MSRRIRTTAHAHYLRIGIYSARTRMRFGLPPLIWGHSWTRRAIIRTLDRAGSTEPRRRQ